MYNHAMAGWLRTFLLIFVAAHLLVISLNHFLGPFDPFRGEGELTRDQITLGTGFYGVLAGLLIFAWVIIWLIVFFLLRDRAKQAEKKQKQNEKQGQQQKQNQKQGQ